MEDNGSHYYMCLLDHGKSNRKSNSSVVIVAHPRDIVLEYPIDESFIVGPLELSLCHKLALEVVTGTRGFTSKESKLQQLVISLDLRHFMTHWVSLDRPIAMSI
jgi:hypothetical protein